MMRMTRMPSLDESDFAGRPLDRVTIVGAGLLGGSLGRALRERRLARRVVGLGRSPERLRRAVDLGCLDAFETDPAAALPGAELVVLCQPVTIIVDFLPECFRLISPGTVVTDVGSTKATIVEAGERAAAARGDGTVFVGSHPMAGSERAGAEHSDPNLFEGATCHVTVTESTPSRAAAAVANLWRRVGMRIIFDHPARHDKMVATISHAPHLVAVALMESLDAINGHPQFQSLLTGPGFRDMTRVAMGSPDIWMDICKENREAIGEGLGRLIEILERWRTRIGSRESLAMEAVFEQARRRRQAFLPTTSPENQTHGEPD